MDISVLIATFAREESLSRTLASISRNVFDGEIQVLVADNAVRNETKVLCDRYSNELNIIYVEAPIKGKNNALNTIIPSANGRIFVFIDDDIVLSNDWFKEIWEGTERYKGATLFAGKVVPELPSGMLMPDHSMVEKFVNAGNWDLEEGPIENHQVLGTSMIVRRHVFDEGMKFNPDVGPCGQDYMMGSETEFNLRLFFYGHTAIYLPKARSFHSVRTVQGSVEWWLKRMKRRGRGSVLMQPEPDVVRLFGAPRYLFKHCLQSLIFMLLYRVVGNREKFIHQKSDYLFTRGKVQQYRVDYSGNRRSL
ncbi:glycosyltransferase family 2 protein [Marinobacter salinexigens]|uniref:Glycosyltransferase family 2 protein n=1 Tax=Marinobacter salinexigens TaxID=2919747 RepID=A0A5B0VLQ5_9GAMM|nr:glycosyltransferase [Marinobacter salinexigens]KAA1175055.1 glycosyltransferase family 2 protein [Marinobacter salinexigens]